MIREKASIRMKYYYILFLVLVAGGEVGPNLFSDVVDIYDVSTGEWSASHLREPCFYTTGAASSGNLVCFFASHIMAGITDSVDIYNTSTRSWSSAAILPNDQITLCAAAVGNQLITLGGNPFQSTTAHYYQLK
jgi:hypothetical protein